MSVNTKLLIPKNFKFLGKDQPTLYKMLSIMHYMPILMI